MGEKQGLKRRLEGGWNRLRSWTQYSRSKALAAGVALLAVPTFFTVVPSWASWDGRVRALVLCAWLLIAVLVVASEVVRSEAIGSLTKERRSLLRHLRLLGTN